MASGVEQRIQYYRGLAAEAIHTARDAADVETRQTYLELARSWKALADAVERFKTAEPPCNSDRGYFQ